jgi:uncharacterized protein YcgL (UPF0745 family)
MARQRHYLFLDRRDHLSKVPFVDKIASRSLLTLMGEFETELCRLS